MHFFRSALLLLVLVVAQGSNGSNGSNANATTTAAPTTTTAAPTTTVAPNNSNATTTVAATTVTATGTIVWSKTVVLTGVPTAVCTYIKNLNITAKASIIMKMFNKAQTVIASVTTCNVKCNTPRRLLEQMNRKLSTGTRTMELAIVAAAIQAMIPSSGPVADMTELKTALENLGFNTTGLDFSSMKIKPDDTSKASAFCVHGLLIACLGLLAGVHFV